MYDREDLDFDPTVLRLLREGPDPAGAGQLLEVRKILYFEARVLARDTHADGRPR